MTSFFGGTTLGMTSVGGGAKYPPSLSPQQQPPSMSSRPERSEVEGSSGFQRSTDCEDPSIPLRFSRDDTAFLGDAAFRMTPLFWGHYARYDTVMSKPPQHPHLIPTRSLHPCHPNRRTLTHVIPPHPTHVIPTGAKRSGGIFRLPKKHRLPRSLHSASLQSG